MYVYIMYTSMHWLKAYITVIEYITSAYATLRPHNQQTWLYPELRVMMHVYLHPMLRSCVLCFVKYSTGQEWTGAVVFRISPVLPWQLSSDNGWERGKTTR